MNEKKGVYIEGDFLVHQLNPGINGGGKCANWHTFDIFNNIKGEN